MAKKAGWPQSPRAPGAHGIAGFTLAFLSTCPRHGELPAAGWLFFRRAALFTGRGPSASLVSQLDMGEFSRVRCRNPGDCS
jgi:hypothetical protein